MREIMSAKPVGQPPAADFGIGKFVRLLLQTARFRFSGSNRGAEARKNMYLVASRPSASKRFQIGIESLRRTLLHMRGEHGFRMPCRKATAGIGRSGLHQHRPALRATRNVERPGHVVIVALVVDRPDAVRPRIASARTIVEDRVVRP